MSGNITSKARRRSGVSTAGGIGLPAARVGLAAAVCRSSRHGFGGPLGSRNFADQHLKAGAKCNYNLLWAVVVAIIAMLAQALSANLGLVTGRNLAGLSALGLKVPEFAK
jgi:hypothetical protein